MVPDILWKDLEKPKFDDSMIVTNVFLKEDSKSWYFNSEKKHIN